jgi:8-oxo-dGTP pyrophosphatase MutT (NUDIX family)
MAQAKKWQEIKRETVYRKYSQTVERRDYRLPSGEIADYYIRIENRGACALAITTDNKIITLPQYRPGPDTVRQDLPGGLVDAGEDSRTAALRELLEETGYAGEIDEWTGTWENDAYTQSDRTVVIVHNCKKIAEPHLDSTEFGEVELLDIPDFIALVRTGKLSDAAGAMLALDHLGLLG